MWTPHKWQRWTWEALKGKMGQKPHVLGIFRDPCTSTLTGTRKFKKWHSLINRSHSHWIQEQPGKHEPDGNKELISLHYYICQGLWYLIPSPSSICAGSLLGFFMTGLLPWHLLFPKCHSHNPQPGERTSYKMTYWGEAPRLQRGSLPKAIKELRSWVTPGHNRFKHQQNSV